MPEIKKTLVTGGCGFIGSHIAELLVKEGHHVTIIDNLVTGRLENIVGFRDAVSFIEADIAETGPWVQAFEGIDWVFHIAALADIVPSIQDPTNYFRSNVQGTFNVLQAAKNADVKRFVYAASSSCYGIPDNFPTPETAPCRPQYPYALTKRLGEELVMHWEQVYKLPAVSLRMFNIYGLRSRTSGSYGAVLGVFLRQKLAGQSFTVVGDGKQTRDFTHVTDVARAYVAVAKSEISGEIFNVGSGTHVSINRLIELIEGDKVHIPKRPGEPDCTFADISKITSQLDWQPRISIEEGVAEILKHIDCWQAAPLWDVNSIKEATKDWFKYLS